MTRFVWGGVLAVVALAALGYLYVNATDGAPAEALKIFDAYLWGEWPEFPQEQIGAISLLWRLDLIGIDGAARWQPIIDQIRARDHGHILPFHDLHTVYALARAGTPAEADDFLASMERTLETRTGTDREIWAGIALPMAAALIAFIRNDNEMAVEFGRAALARLAGIGGSHAQRQVFIDTIAEAEARAGLIDTRRVAARA